MKPQIRLALLRAGFQRSSFATLACLALLYAQLAQADIGIVLKKSFIDEYANRATIIADYKVVKTHPHAKPASEDGDIHCSGTASNIGLACVAEIVNAKTQPDGIQRLVDSENGPAIPVTGVWRLWPEHANGGKDFVQGAAIDPITDTNPPHIFEIHPLTEVDGIDVRSSFTKVSGYSYKKDTVSFDKFENAPCRIEVNGNKVTLITNQIGYNYTRFKVQLLEDPTHKLDDGNTSVFCRVPGSEEDVPLVSKLRCIFVDGTPPQEKLQTLHAGDELKVIGVPRIDLALVKYRVEHRSDNPSILNRSLPYEMIIVGLDK